MELGIIAFVTDLTIGPAELARAVEERGFESVWFPEHSHLPLDSGGWPGGPSIPEHYARTVDQFVAIAAAAAVTERVRIGSAVCLVPQHDPIWLAKQAASADFVSGGRLTLGLGFGWNRPELADHGVEFRTRRERTRECVLAMQTLWHEETASFEGRYVRFGPSRAWPKPRQRPHPPILIGAGAGPKTRAAIAEYADGWAPMFGRDDIEGRLDAVRAAWADAGRDPAAFDLTVLGAPADPAQLERLAALGARRAVLGVPPADADKVLAALDRHAELLERVG